VGQKLREAGNDQYHDLRRSLKKDGQSLQEIEDELYQVDQQLIEKLQGQYGEI
jgi:DNA replication initiation complex subunit (GINS family)